MTDPRVEAVVKAIKARTPSKPMTICRIEAEDFIVMADALQAFVIADALRTFDQSAADCEIDARCEYCTARTFTECGECKFPNQTRDESEVMPHSDPGQSVDGQDNATTPVMGADPPWLYAKTRSFRMKLGDDRVIVNGCLMRSTEELVEIFLEEFRSLLAFANAQPPSEAEKEAAARAMTRPSDDPDRWRCKLQDANAALIAAAKVRSAK